MRTIRKVRLKGGDTSSELLNERISRINSEIVVLESYIKSGHEKDIKAGKNKLRKLNKVKVKLEKAITKKEEKKKKAMKKMLAKKTKAIKTKDDSLDFYDIMAELRINTSKGEHIPLKKMKTN